MKDYNHIERLLERLYNAETSEQEEQELKDFFRHGEVPPHLLPEKEMFLQLQASDAPEGMEERLGNLIDQWELSEQKTQKKRRIFHLQWIGSIAASLLLVIGISLHFHEPQRKDTCATPEEAYAHAEKALVMFSEALNKGIRPIQDMEKTNENIRKQINKLNNIELWNAHL